MAIAVHVWVGRNVSLHEHHNGGFMRVLCAEPELDQVRGEVGRSSTTRHRIKCMLANKPPESEFVLRMSFCVAVLEGEFEAFSFIQCALSTMQSHNPVVRAFLCFNLE